MELSNKEQQEVNYLRELRQSRIIPMMQKDQDRLQYLNRKEFHNGCSNVSCTGYTGTKEETICPKCKSKLHKVI